MYDKDLGSSLIDKRHRPFAVEYADVGDDEPDVDRGAAWWASSATALRDGALDLGAHAWETAEFELPAGLARARVRFSCAADSADRANFCGIDDVSVIALGAAAEAATSAAADAVAAAAADAAAAAAAAVSASGQSAAPASAWASAPGHTGLLALVGGASLLVALGVSHRVLLSRRTRQGRADGTAYPPVGDDSADAVELIATAGAKVDVDGDEEKE